MSRESEVNPTNSWATRKLVEYACPAFLVSFCTVVLIAAFITGCPFPPGTDAIDEPIIGPYKLYAQDDAEQSAVVYDIGGGAYIYRVDPVVVDVGWNDSYIVATSRLPDSPGGELSYYYIDIAKDGEYGGDREGAVVGPLTEARFEAAKSGLSLPEFTVHYPKLR
jgi:hypothetical protein